MRYNTYNGLEDGIFFAFFGFFILFIIAICLISYVINGISLQRMAKKLNLENPWLAWIPIGNLYLMGKIAGDRLKMFGYEIKELAIVTVAVWAVGSFCSSIPYIGFIFLIAYVVFYYFIYYKIYRIFNEQSATLYLILSILFGFFQPFILLICSTKEPNMFIFYERLNQNTNPNYNSNTQGYQDTHNQSYSTEEEIDLNKNENE